MKKRHTGDPRIPQFQNLLSSLRIILVSRKLRSALTLFELHESTVLSLIVTVILGSPVSRRHLKSSVTAKAHIFKLCGLSGSLFDAAAYGEVFLGSTRTVIIENKRTRADLASPVRILNHAYLTIAA